jgi:hypothetical protein
VRPLGGTREPAPVRNSSRTGAGTRNASAVSGERYASDAITCLTTV